MDSIFELRTQKKEDDLLRYGQRRLELSAEYQQREADLKMDEGQLLKSKENIQSRETKLTADMPTDDAGEKESKRKKKRKARLSTEQAKVAEVRKEQEQTGQQRQNEILTTGVMDEKARRIFTETLSPAMFSPDYVMHHYEEVRKRLDEWKEHLQLFEREDALTVMQKSESVRLSLMRTMYDRAENAFQTALCALGFVYTQDGTFREADRAEAEAAQEKNIQSRQQLLELGDIDEKVVDELRLAEKAELLQSARAFQEGMQEQERYAFIHSEHLSYAAQYEELAALKEQLEQAKAGNSAPYQKYEAALLEMYQEFFTLQELCGRYNTEATAIGALLLEQDEAAPQNIQNALQAALDKQHEKIQLISHRADCIKAGILHILEERPMTNEQASIVREYVQADNKDQLIQGNAGAFLEKERTQQETYRQMLADGAANGYAEVRQMLLADLQGIRDLDMQNLDHYSPEELLGRAEELQRLALAGSFAGEVAKYLDAQDGAAPSIIDTVAGAKKEEFLLKWKLVWAHAGRAKMFSLLQAYARGNLTQEYFSAEEQKAIRAKCGLNEEAALTDKDMLVYLKDRLQIYEAQIPAAYNAYFQTKEAKATFAEHKGARADEVFIYDEFEQELDDKEKAVCTILDVEDLNTNKVQELYNQQKEMLKLLKEQRQPGNGKADEEIKNRERTLEYIEIAYALTGNHAYTLAGEKKPLIREAMLRTIGAVKGMKGVADMGQAGYIEMCRKLAAGALAGQTATPQELAAYREENLQGLAEYKELMKLQYEELENRFHHTPPSVEYIIEHSAELNHIFANVQVDNNLVLHSNEIIDIHNEEDMKLLHLVQVYHAMGSYINLVYTFNCHMGSDYQTSHEMAAKMMEKEVKYSFEYLDREERGMTEAEKQKQEIELAELEKFRTAYIRMTHVLGKSKEENFQRLLMLEELKPYLEAHKDDTTPEVKMMRDMYHYAAHDIEKTKRTWAEEISQRLKLPTNVDGFMLLYARYKAKAEIDENDILPLAEKLAALRVTPEMMSEEYIRQHREELLASFEEADAYERMLEEDPALAGTIPAEQRLVWEKNKKLYEQYRTYVNAYARSCLVDLESGEYLTEEAYLAEKETFAGKLSEAKEQVLSKLKFSQGFETYKGQLKALSEQLENEKSLKKAVKTELLKALSDAGTWLADMDTYLKTPIEVTPEEFFDAKLMTFMSMFGYMERGLREARAALSKTGNPADFEGILSELSGISDSFSEFRQRIPGQAKELRNAIMESGGEKKLSLQDVVNYAQEIKTFTRDAQTRSVGAGTSEVLRFQDGEQLYFFKEDEKLKGFKESAEETLEILQEDEIAGCFKALIENVEETGVEDNDTMYQVAFSMGSLLDEAGNVIDSQLEQFNALIGSQHLEQYLTDAQNREKWKQFTSALKKDYETARQAQSVGLQLEAGADMTARNYATERVAELLGLKSLIIRNQAAVVLEADGTVKKGFVMDGAKGKTAGAFKLEVYEKSKQGYHVYVEEQAQKQLLNLQVLDNITGQTDRNMGNYFLVYDVDDEKRTITVKQVTGIDNDFAFGKSERILYSPSLAYEKTKAGYQFALDMMDKELYDSMMAVSPELLAVNLEGLIEPEYIKALTARYEALRNSIKEAAQTREDFFREKGKWGVDAQNKAVMGITNRSFLAQLLPKEEQPERVAAE